jgi:hypothetical protein
LDPDDAVASGCGVVAFAHGEPQPELAAGGIEKVPAMARAAEPGLQGLFDGKALLDEVLADAGAVSVSCGPVGGRCPR